MTAATVLHASSPGASDSYGPAARVAQAAGELQRGRPVILVNPHGASCGGELVIGAEHATPGAVAFVVRHSSGYLRVALPERRADALGLPLCAPEEPGRHGAACAVSVDAADGVTTGISAAARARTISLLGSRTARPAHFSRPGHVVPLRTWSGGLHSVAAVGEAAAELAAAGLTPVAAIASIVSPADGTQLAPVPELAAFARMHHLTVVSIDDLAAMLKCGDHHLCLSTAEGTNQP